MATLVFSSLGTALGGPLGGAIGAMAGRQFDASVFGPSARNGPRLRELEVSLSSYGVAIPRLHGRIRVAGAIIWATELQEHSDLRGTGKAQPATTTYSYSANLAVALSSRQIVGIGRIWADGKLLRGAAGDLKTGGILRIHRGTHDQAVDPLIAASEGEARCPAFRGLAYVVFEALDLTDFGNRIPALTFEVIADDGAVRLADMIGDTVADVRVPQEIENIVGFAIEDSLGASLAGLDPVIPMGLDAAGETIVVQAAAIREDAVMLGEPAISGEDDAFAPARGTSRRRAPIAARPAPVLRYLDVARDYQPGTRHAGGRAGDGQPDIVELPAALDSNTAGILVEQMATRQDAARERIAWRTCTLDSRIATGSAVRLPDRKGTWRVESSEWREDGIELELSRIAATFAASPAPPDGVAFPSPPDLPGAETRLVALELPWDGTGGAAPRPRLAIAASADGPNWRGAALFAEGPNAAGHLHPLGPARRVRAVVGVALDRLRPASPLLLDRGGSLTVELAAADLALSGASIEDLANGVNLALVGDELIQFATADPLGNGRWRLGTLIRGCAGTEAAVHGHAVGDPFALLDGRITVLDPPIDLGPQTTIMALGQGDAAPAASPLRLAGVTLRPLAPVHGRGVMTGEGVLRLVWTRRARGAWTWRDGVDVALVEERERYLVTHEDAAGVLHAWSVIQPLLALSADDLAQVAWLGRDRSFDVQQQGTHGLSLPHRITIA
jgi:hypothetical protein